MTVPMPLKVLVIDDDADTRLNLCDILELDQHQVETAGTAAEALGRRDWTSFSAILLDRRLPDGTAEELLPRVKALAPDAAILIVTGYADLQGAITALRQGIEDYILKPIDPDALRASVARVSERKRLQLEKERSEAAFGTLVQAAPCLIVILSPQLEIVYFSRFAEELTGYRADEAVGQRFLKRFLPGDGQGRFGEQLGQVLHGRPMRGVEAQVVCKDSSQRWTLWNAALLPDYEGQPAVLAVGQDITDLKLAQEKAVQSARLAGIGQMMTGLAHESGNALARSQACLEMLALEVTDKPEALDLIHRIEKAQDHLRHLYEEVRGYAAPLKLEREAWNLAAVWRQAWENLSLARKGRQTVLREHTSELDLHCQVDHFRLEQVFRNIFENALAACSGPVEIDITCTPAILHRRPALRLSVRDNGPGLSAEQARRIFEPFFTTKTKGTGLGMAIAQRIIEAHGGKIEVAPSSGRGAEILITLPRDLP
jgi:hypothetical protein